MTRVRFLTGLLALSTTLFATPLMAAERGVDPRVKEWLSEMGAIDALLREEQWVTARQRSDVLVREFADRLAIRGSSLIGTALLQRAIAVEAMGERDEALWDAFAGAAFMARAPEVLAARGQHGAALLEALTKKPEEPELDSVANSGLGLVALWKPDEEEDRSSDEEPVLRVGDEVEAPVKLSGPEPPFPPAMRGTVRPEHIIVQVVVDKTGRPREPEVLKGGARPVLLLGAFEALRHWRFKPARLHGKPVDVYYTLTVNYRN